jgi:hypothetical protein
LLLELTVFFSSCKNKWKEPVDVVFTFETKQIHQNPSSLQVGEVYIDSANIDITGFSFKGERQQGKSDISFSVNNPDDFVLADGISQPFSITKQLPQGTYQTMTFVLETGVITLKGFVQTENYGLIPFFTTINTSQNNNLKGINSSGFNDIVLEKGAAKNSSVVFEVQDWFSQINLQAWNNVDFENLTGQPQGQPNKRIVIDAQNNISLYLNLINNIEKSIHVIF